MERKVFLQFIADYTLVNQSLLKRVFSEVSLKELKGLWRKAEEAKLIYRHIYHGLECFSLTRLGFQMLGIDHSPHFNFTKTQADHICHINHLRYGMTEELQYHPTLSLTQWLGGGAFAKRPIQIKVDFETHTLRPDAMARMLLPHGEERLYFIHIWKKLPQVQEDLLLYFVLHTRREYLKRFQAQLGTELRVLCLIPSYKIFYDQLNQIQNTQGEAITLFLPLSKTHMDAPLSQKIWVNGQGKRRSMLTSSSGGRPTSNLQGVLFPSNEDSN